MHQLRLHFMHQLRLPASGCFSLLTPRSQPPAWNSPPNMGPHGPSLDFHCPLPFNIYSFFSLVSIPGPRQTQITSDSFSVLPLLAPKQAVNGASIDSVCLREWGAGKTVNTHSGWVFDPVTCDGLGLLHEQAWTPQHVGFSLKSIRSLER